MKVLSILLDIKLHVMSTSQLFWKKVHLTTKYHCGMETWHCWIFMFGIMISETNYSNKEKGKNPTLQELRKNSYIFIEQECVLRVSNSEKIATLLTHKSTIVYGLLTPNSTIVYGKWIFWRNQYEFWRSYFQNFFCLFGWFLWNFCENKSIFSGCK